MVDYSSLNDATLQALIVARRIDCPSKTRDKMVACLVGYDSENNATGGMTIDDIVLLGKIKKAKPCEMKAEAAPKKPKAEGKAGKGKSIAKGKGKAKGAAKGKGKAVPKAKAAAPDQTPVLA